MLWASTEGFWNSVFVQEMYTNNNNNATNYSNMAIRYFSVWFPLFSYIV